MSSRPALIVATFLGLSARWAIRHRRLAPSALGAGLVVAGLMLVWAPLGVVALGLAFLAADWKAAGGAQ